MFVQDGLIIRYSLLAHLNYQYQISNIQFHNQMKNKVILKEIRSQFKIIKQQILQEKMKNVKISRIESQQIKCEKILQQMSQNNTYDDYDQVINMQQIYKELKQILKENKDNEKVSSTYSNKLNKLKNLFLYNKESTVKEYKPLSQSNSQVNPFDVQINDKNHTQNNFFRKKEREIKSKDSSFKKILQTSQLRSQKTNKSSMRLQNISKSSIKKKEDEKQKYLKKIIEQHKKMVNSLQYKVKSEEQLNEFQKNLLKEQKNRYLQKIQEMQAQIEQLYRDNYRLKQLQKTKQNETFNVTSEINKSKDSNSHQPYILKTQSNDLNKINQKNFKKSQEKVKQKKIEKSPEREDYFGSKLQKQRPLTSNQFFNIKPNKNDLYEQKFEQDILRYLQQDEFHEKGHKKVAFKQQKSINRSREQKVNNNKMSSFRNQNSRNISNGSINQGSHFDTFQMANTLSFVHDSVLGQSRQVTRITSEVCTRNKVAFFKNSLVLIRQANIQIACKKSDLNEKMDKIRVIFYINNKTNVQRKIKIVYQYQQQYFSIIIAQKLHTLGPNSQGRQVIEVELISKTDLNGVTDIHVQVDKEVYDLWLPVNFIRFKTTNNYRMIHNESQMTVVPDRQFSSFQNIKQVVPFMYGGKDEFEEWIYLYGQSKFGSHSIKLTWKENQLLIQCNQKWIEFIGFIIHFFK